MIELASITPDPKALPASPKRPRGDETAFSYALAEASLEKSAGAALKTFGAAPKADDAAARPGEAAAQQARSPVAADGGTSISYDAARTTPAVSASAAAAATVKADPPPVLAPSTAAGPAGAAVPAPLIAAPPPPAAATARPTLASDASRAEALRAPAKAETRPVRADPPARTPAAFAEVIAKRLADGKSEFEIRLDPPQLGRVEGRLVVGDDGKTTLALVFDTQAALAQFAADGEALRTALATAGFDLGQSSLSFSLADRDGERAGRAVAGDEPPHEARAALLAASAVIDIKV